MSSTGMKKRGGNEILNGSNAKRSKDISMIFPRMFQKIQTYSKHTAKKYATQMFI